MIKTFNKHINPTRTIDSFDRRFNRTRNTIRIGSFVIIGITVAIFIFTAIIGYHAITNPESIGMFFGKIFKGFNSIQ